MPVHSDPSAVEVVADQGAFDQLLHSLAKEPLLAVDTEAASFHRYEDRVYLLQISSRERTAVVDPLAVESLERFAALLADPRIEVIFHDADYDLRLLQRQYGIRAARLFATRNAAQFLNEPGIGLAALLEKYFGVTLNKKYQRADWSARPLSAEMLAYAATDTRHLPALRDELRGQLEAPGQPRAVDVLGDRVAVDEEVGGQAGGRQPHVESGRAGVAGRRAALGGIAAGLHGAPGSGRARRRRKGVVLYHFDRSNWFLLIGLAFREENARARWSLLLELLLLVPAIASFHAVCFFLDGILFPGLHRVSVREPVFLVGHARSGTTLLHRLMSRDGARFSSFRLYEMYFPSLLQKKAIRALATFDRRTLGGLFERRVKAWEQLIGTLQVMVLQGGVVDLQDEIVLIRGIGDCRIEMLGGFSKRGVQGVLGLLRRTVRVVRAARERGQYKRETDQVP